jgi:hypothetical protein
MRCALSAHSDTTEFTADGGSGSLRVTTTRECTWSVASDASWLSVSGNTSGQGEGAVRFTVARNDDPGSRSAPLRVNDQQMSISQVGRPCAIRLSSTHEIVDAAGGERSVHVETSSSQCRWSAAAGVGWINILRGSAGTGNGTVTFEVAPETGPSRSGTLTIAGQTVTVEQGNGCRSAPGVSTLRVGAAGGRADLPVTAAPGCTWTAVSSVPWIAVVTGQTGTGAGTVVLQVSAAAGPSRIGTITVAGQSVRIEQGNGCTYAIGSSSLSAPASGGALDLAVLSPQGCSWSAVSQTAWIEITSGAGSGNGTVRMSVRPSDGPVRSGTLSVEGTIVTISQASGCRFSVAPSTYDAAASGGSSSLTIQTGAGCAWVASSDMPWITLAHTSGAGPGSATLAVAPNDGPARSGQVTIAGQAVAVRQASRCTWAIAPPSADYDANGGRGSVLVIVVGGCSWTATSAVDWIRIETGMSGSGEGLVQFIVEPNSGQSRSGVVKIAGIDLRVRQSGR